MASILNAKPAEAMGGEYIPMILSLQGIIGFEKTSEISSSEDLKQGHVTVTVSLSVYLSF